MFVFFTVIMIFVILSMFLSIVDESYGEVKDLLARQASDPGAMDPLTEDCYRLFILFPKTILSKAKGKVFGVDNDKISTEEKAEKKELTEEEKMQLELKKLYEKNLKLFNTSIDQIKKIEISQSSMEDLLFGMESHVKAHIDYYISKIIK